MKGNQFLQRCRPYGSTRTASTSTARTSGRWSCWAAARSRGSPQQALCLAALWALKLNPATALIFPSVIGVLMVRAKVLPKIFTTQELRLLDTRIGATKA